jgi:hypothetical protein
MISLLVSLIKWPTAVAVAALTPAAAISFWDLSRAAWEASYWKSPFAIGFGGMLIFMLLFQRTRFVQFWATLEHEFTHALFAWLTFVPVYDLWTSDGSGASRERPFVGVVRLGGDNWLISTAPYFFPTASAIVLGATLVLAKEPTVAANVLLGIATAACVVSTWHETHAEQTDLKTAGKLFSVIFLPGANVLCYGSLLAYELGGPSGAWSYMASAPERTIAWMQSLT